MSTTIIGRGHIIDSNLPSKRKLSAALKHYNGHHGNETIAHIERNIQAVWPTAPTDLTGKQYGQLMSVANQSYHDGANSKHIDTWAYDGELDWLAGIKGTNTVIVVDHDTITITTDARTEKEIVRTYKLQSPEVANA